MVLLEVPIPREHLSEEDHAHILQKMVAGSIASRETIIESLDRSGDQDNHKICWDNTSKVCCS